MRAVFVPNWYYPVSAADCALIRSIGGDTIFAATATKDTEASFENIPSSMVVIYQNGLCVSSRDWKPNADAIKDVKDRMAFIRKNARNFAGLVLVHEAHPDTPEFYAYLQDMVNWCHSLRPQLEPVLLCDNPASSENVRMMKLVGDRASVMAEIRHDLKCNTPSGLWLGAQDARVNHFVQRRESLTANGRILRSLDGLMYQAGADFQLPLFTATEHAETLSDTTAMPSGWFNRLCLWTLPSYKKDGEFVTRGIVDMPDFQVMIAKAWNLWHFCRNWS